jgi:hypothetical protein
MIYFANWYKEQLEYRDAVWGRSMDTTPYGNKAYRDKLDETVRDIKRGAASGMENMWAVTLCKKRASHFTMAAHS